MNLLFRGCLNHSPKGVGNVERYSLIPQLTQALRNETNLQPSVSKDYVCMGADHSACVPLVEHVSISDVQRGKNPPLAMGQRGRSPP